MWPFDHVVLRDDMADQKHIYTTTKPMTTEHDSITTKSMFIKLDSMVTYLEELLPIYNHMTL